VRVDLSRMTAAAIEAALDDGKEQQRRPRLSGMRAVATGAALAVAARAAVKHGPGLAQMRHLASLPDLVRDRLADHGWLPDDEERDDAEYDDDDPEAEGDEDFDDDDPEAEGDEDFDDDDPEAEGDDDFDEDDDDEDDGDDEDDDFDGPEAQAEEDDEPDDGEEDDEDFDDEPEAEAEVGDDEDVDEEPDADVDEDEGEEEAEEARNGRRTTAQGRRSAPRLEVPHKGGGGAGEVPEVFELLSARRSRPPVMSRRRRAARVDPVLRPPEPPERESDDAKAGTRK